MATLHVLSHSPFTDSRLGSCLRILGSQDALLLCGDAVYALQAGSVQRQALELMPESTALFALDEDVQARGLDLPARLTQVDYCGFVALSCQYDKVNTWL
ncbi:tRNA 2-thiouridine synthesizing protein B [Pseudomonas guineae]|uniref:tRNA 2-thiouridine synthesizing protein B n=1 Tax=Pseudomonas guineae TaxID=425504 RepID=A0A1I3HZL6_9PSED|nr:sulfurtransferase complex subunit TusB [Pseudomonas guineae]SFI41208.1 tRNA 2-thiouridine synthesizing protein B [Pseudomonas guineae]|tara:strand:+ start:285 stop:584 length:300 start_codon:yes stop_codon:yes gene_type:complete